MEAPDKACGVKRPHKKEGGDGREKGLQDDDSEGVICLINFPNS